MQVETYEIEEVAQETVEMTNEAKELIENLGLDGQKSLLQKTQRGEISRCPYREMTQVERFVFEQLCPQKTSVEAYAGGPIPVRVLQVLAHAKNLNFFSSFKVWAARTDPKDPLLVGYTGKEYTETAYLLARWAEELDEWPVLVKKAIAAWKVKIEAKLMETQRRLARDRVYLEELKKLDDGQIDVSTLADMRHEPFYSSLL